MPQAGIHALVGTAVRKWVPKTQWLMLGLLLGNVFPDMDNVAVAVATLLKQPTEGLHRTFTHSIFTIFLIVMTFWVIGQIKKQPRWTNFGLGFGVGILMHILLDLVIWFNGVAIIWPIPSWINLWEGVKPPDWFDKFMNPAEMLCIVVFFMVLDRLARQYGTDTDFLRTLRIWTMVEVVLFVIFTPLAYLMQKGFLTLFGIGYLFSLFLAFGVIIRMRKTVEAGV
jgi:membrane-bound metal-dependent hydrolase YbcI (DUF457 family)